ncbi:MAG TPA: nicotinate phosphoribosyltransferase [Bryobacteraceae bacterium]|nr:nicotinate phosphoribosyltransferase [Bryobacteraceae bacterium]
MTGLLTDLYQLTMAAGYFEAGKHEDRAVFELFFRRLPANRNYVIAAGLQQVVDYLANLRFRPEEVEYLRSLAQFRSVQDAFFEELLRFCFRGDLYAIAEGTPVFAEEPLLTVRAPLLQAQIVETYLLATVGFQSLIATKAARICEVAGKRGVVEFGTRRAHSPQAGVLAARAAYIGGCIGTSNTEAGYRYGIPVFGTAAHSWVQSFASERESYERLQRLLGPETIYLIDTYDTIAGAQLAASLGKPLWGVRLDSGNLVELSREVRRILDDAGLREAKIMATSDLNEYKILEFMAAGAPLDGFGVGTDLATSADAPAIGAVYKLVELEENGGRRYTAKLSEGKHTRPGMKQVFRYADHDEIARAAECGTDPGNAVPLIRPVMVGGELVEPLPDVHAARQNARESLDRLPIACRSLFEAEQEYPVEYSPELKRLSEGVLAELNTEAQR